MTARRITTCSLCLVAFACARTARKDVTPPLASDAAQAAAEQAALQDPEAGRALSPAEQIDHALARVTFGARPGDHDRVAHLGISAFLE